MVLTGPNRGMKQNIVSEVMVSVDSIVISEILCVEGPEPLQSTKNGKSESITITMYIRQNDAFVPKNSRYKTTKISVVVAKSKQTRPVFPPTS